MKLHRMPRRCCSPTQPASGTRSRRHVAAEEAAAALSALDTEGGRTTDPVRMYMREMGTVELLTREGEIAIAKRIEEGLNQVHASLASFPWSIQLLLEDYDLHIEGKKRLAEVVIGFLDLEPPVEEIPAVVVDRRRRRESRTTPRTTARTARKPRPSIPARIRLEVARRMEAARAPATRKFQKSYAKNGPADKKALKLREEMAEEFLTPEAAAGADRRARAQAARSGQLDQGPRAPHHGHLPRARRKMPRKDFLRAWPGNETNLRLGRRRHQAQAEVVVGRARRTRTIIAEQNSTS